MQSESPDVSITKLQDGQNYLISTTDFFYPLVPDPFLQGQIAAANVLSDLYALGITKVDNFLMLLGVCTTMTPQEKEISTKQIIQGFSQICQKADVKISGGQTVKNPWYLIGGVANSVLTRDQFILPDPLKVQRGDVLVLTKPLGTQVVVNIFEMFYYKRERWEKLQNPISEFELLTAYSTAVNQMTRLNKIAAQLMKKYNAKGATDITGFGIKGHANNLAQTCKKDLKIHTLPIIKNMLKLDKQVRDFKLKEGLSAETSGGLLIIFENSDAEKFIQEIQKIEHFPAWIIGRVEDSQNPQDPSAEILQEANIIEV